jgi:hypothetical protein
MLLLTKKINIRLPREDRVHSFLKSIPDKLWQGWTITRKQNTSNLNFSVTNTTNVGISVIKLNTVWNELIILEPNLIEFDPDLTKCWVTKMAPGGGIFSHVDYKRDIAKLIPIGPNKGEIHYHLHWKWKPFYTYKYTGPTLTRTNIPHSVKNETGEDRYVIQIADKIPNV